MPDVTVRQFQSAVQTFTLRNEAGTAIDLTGKTLKFCAKRLATDADTLLLFDITAALVVAVDGTYSLTFPYAATARIPGSYYASLRVWDAAPTTDPPDRTERSTYTIEAAARATEV